MTVLDAVILAVFSIGDSIIRLPETDVLGVSDVIYLTLGTLANDSIDIDGIEGYHCLSVREIPSVELTTRTLAVSSVLVDAPDQITLDLHPLISLSAEKAL